MGIAGSDGIRGAGAAASVFLTRRLALGLGVALAAVRPGMAADGGTIRIGMLQFGTVSWELDVIRQHQLDREHGFTLVVQPYGGNDAADVALMGDAVDAIVEDWLMVSRERGQGGDLTFALPYSSTLGAVMVRKDDPAASLKDLRGRKLGIAGGALDKSWLLLKAYAATAEMVDLGQDVEPVFAAPPLLNEKLNSGELDAVISYWNWCAVLEAQGCRRLVSIAQAQERLGVPPATPQLGFVVKQGWADQHADLVQRFAKASLAAKEIMASSDGEWERLRPLTRAADDATLAVLRQRYREGIVRRWGEPQREDATRLYAILAGIGGEALVGRAATLSPGTFWQPMSF